MNSGTTNPLNAVWGNSSTDVFAVGGYGTILHYEGNAWSPMTSGTTQHLEGVWGSSGSDVFAVGEGGTILHYSEQTICSTWADVISKHNTYVNGQAKWSDVIECYNQYASHQ